MKSFITCAFPKSGHVARQDDDHDDKSNNNNNKRQDLSWKTRKKEAIRKT
jgi:hypothetical protein